MYQRAKSENCPVSLDELKQWNYIESNLFDEKLKTCLYAAIASAESHANIIIWPSTFTLALDHIEHEIPVFACPVSSISIIVDGSPLAASLYQFDGNVILVDGSVQGSNMTVTLEAGIDPMDDDIRSAILLISSELFRNPTDSVKQLPTASQLLLQPFRRANI
jgi:hypothetical protein